MTYKIATPSGTGETVQPCAVCGQPVHLVRVGIAGSPGPERMWLHTLRNLRVCSS